MARGKDLVRWRAHHYLAARLIAEGKRSMEVAAAVGLAPARISSLKAHPEFQEIVEQYKDNAERLRDMAYYDVQRKYALLEANGLDRLNDRYEEDPDSITHAEARADAEFASDRLGRKVQQSVNLTISKSLAERLEEQRLRVERLGSPVIEGNGHGGADGEGV